MRWLLILMLTVSVSAQSIGEIGYLDNGTDFVICAISEKAFNECIKYVNASDKEGIALMMMKGAIMALPQYTKVRVIDQSWGLKQVRILEGDYYASAFWTNKEHVKK